MEKVKTPVKISDSEWEIMRVIWTLGQTTAQEITQILADSMDWKPATIKTLLGRLVKKRSDLDRTRRKKIHLSSSCLGDGNSSQCDGKSFFHICAKRIGETIADLVEEATLTQEDINEILKQLEQKQPVDTIECNCIPGQCECKQHQ